MPRLRPVLPWPRLDPGGWLLDRFRAPRVYLAAIILWSLFTAAQGAVVWLGGAAAITTLFVFRFLVGMAETPSFPGNARLVASWFPSRERGAASAIFNSAQYFATVLFAPIMVRTAEQYSTTVAAG